MLVCKVETAVKLTEYWRRKILGVGNIWRVGSRRQQHWYGGQFVPYRGFVCRNRKTGHTCNSWRFVSSGRKHKILRCHTKNVWREYVFAFYSSCFDIVGVKGRNKHVSTKRRRKHDSLNGKCFRHTSVMWRPDIYVRRRGEHTRDSFLSCFCVCMAGRKKTWNKSVPLCTNITCQVHETFYCRIVTANIIVIDKKFMRTWNGFLAVMRTSNGFLAFMRTSNGFLTVNEKSNGFLAVRTTNGFLEVMRTNNDFLVIIRTSDDFLAFMKTSSN